MDELSDREKAKLVKQAMEILAPIAAKYELDYELGHGALLEAFQAGIRFAVQQHKEVQDGD